MKVMPAIETRLLTVGFVIVEVPKVAVSPMVSGTFAGVQFGALFQLLFAGTAFQVCARPVPGISTRPHSTAIDDASILAGLGVGTRREVAFIFGQAMVVRFMRVFSDC